MVFNVCKLIACVAAVSTMQLVVGEIMTVHLKRQLKRWDFEAAHRSRWHGLFWVA
jgi:hypothetical protein